jgi:16S rRNA (cytosine1402-N4)-methyltransferase
MVEEVLSFLEPRKDATFVDLTVGGGGHAAVLAELLGPGGTLVGIDLDPRALELARKRLADRVAARVILIHGNFADCDRLLAEAGIEGADGMLADLGVCSLHLDDPKRGFSFRSEAPLDMRMDTSSDLPTAADIVNEASQGELEDIFREYGQERFARKIARLIVRERDKVPIETTEDLARIARRAYGPRWRRIHPATRIFQALRIAVNAELDNLGRMLSVAPEVLRGGGRLAVISFHSLEDRIVKEDFRNRAAQGVYNVLTKKPVRPSEREVSENPRARSAKLRAAQRSVL